MSCDVGEVMEGATKGLANEALPILQPFQFSFTYVTGTSPTSPGEPHMFSYLIPLNDIKPNSK